MYFYFLNSGGVYLNQGNDGFHLVNSTIVACHSYLGGGFFANINNQQTRIFNSTFKYSSAGYFGGAVGIYDNNDYF